jgi:hypothetical protein
MKKRFIKWLVEKVLKYKPIELSDVATASNIPHSHDTKHENKIPTILVKAEQSFDAIELLEFDNEKHPERIKNDVTKTLFRIIKNEGYIEFSSRDEFAGKTFVAKLFIVDQRKTKKS